jgi:hypothetical protein
MSPRQSPWTPCPSFHHTVGSGFHASRTRFLRDPKPKSLDRVSVSYIATAQGLRPTLTEADGLVPGCVPRLEQPQQCNHLRARLEIGIRAFPNLNQPWVQILLLTLILFFLLALVFSMLQIVVSRLQDENWKERTNRGREKDCPSFQVHHPRASSILASSQSSGCYYSSGYYSAARAPQIQGDRHPSYRSVPLCLCQRLLEGR